MANFSDYIKGCFSPRYYGYSNIIPRNPDINVSNNPTNSYCIRLDLTKDELFIPCHCIKCTEHILEYNMANVKTLDAYSEVILPLYDNYYRYNSRNDFKGSIPLIKLFFHDVSDSSLLAQAKCNGTTYYGGRGIILYEDFTPMMIMGIKLHKTELNTYNIIHPVIYIDPKVYNNDLTLSKYIRGKFLTELSYMRYSGISDLSYCTLISSIYTNQGKLNFNFEVLVTDEICKFISSPTIPTANTTSDDINNFAIKNINSLMNSYEFG